MNKPTLSCENIGPVRVVKFFKQKTYCRRRFVRSSWTRLKVSQVLQALSLKTYLASAPMSGSGNLTFTWSGRSCVEAMSKP